MTTENLRDRLEQRWNRRQAAERDGREPLTVQSTVEISKPAQEVWDFLTSPYAAVLLDHHHVRSFPLPDTPEGVGQQNCSLRRGANGRLEATVTEVIEFEPPHRYVAKSLTGPSEILEAMVISPTPSGCTYTTSVGMRIAYGTSRKVAPVAQRAIDESTAKVRSFVESGIRLETVNESRDEHGEGAEPESTSPTGDPS